MTEIQLANQSRFEAHTLEGLGGLKIDLLPSGQLFAIQCNEIQINQILASPLAGGVHRILVRVHGEPQIRAIPIVGSEAKSTVRAGNQAFIWDFLDYQLQIRCICTLHPERDAWFFRVEVKNIGDRAVACDAILLQDLGLATRGHVRNNELFTSQYIDHFAVEHPAVGYVVMSRQNLPQVGETHPWLMQGCLPKASGFLTDGMDFFGSGHRAGEPPKAPACETIGKHLHQGELAYIAIQSNANELKPGEACRWTFFAEFELNHTEPSSPADLERVNAIIDASNDSRPLDDAVDLSPAPYVFESCTIYPAEECLAADLDRLYPGSRRHVENLDGKIASFFYGEDARHVVLRHKQVVCARPHGHILRAGRGLMPDSEILACTCWGDGIFAGPLTVGNATLSKLFSGRRDPLNVIRSSGLRIFVRTAPSEPWQLLAVPSAMEMGLDFCRWHYLGADRRLTVSCQASETDPSLSFEILSSDGAIESLICGEVAAGPNEYDTSARLQVDHEQKRLTVQPATDSLLGQKQPDLRFHVVISNPEVVASIGADETLCGDGKSRGLPYLTIQTRPTNAFKFTIEGQLHSEKSPELQSPSSKGFWSEITAGLRIHSKFSRMDEIQDALTWFARDAVIHLSAPRGLDQPNGGAWGVRDVAQGAVEFLLSYGQTDTVAEILRRLFSQQYDGRFDWPQWFMFPPFEQIQSPHCHGDVMIWPLKALCDYLEESNDLDFLREKLQYTNAETFKPTAHAEDVLQHVDRLIHKLREQFIPGLSLPRYGEGDWDDSLQPADASLRQRMVSSWTTELIYQTLKRYQTAMERAGESRRAQDVETLAGKIFADFQRHLMPGGVVAGFAVFDGDPLGPIEYLLHPSDQRTGIRYRLIPMTRGILSEIFSPQQAQDHLGLIEKHLLFPDGARLMDCPARYSGGKEQTFRRSESAAFFGREIGLQYVHAHLRYAEAMAKLGRAEDLWRALLVVNPIAATQIVPNSRPRQRNCYFSSSDAEFPTRYAANRHYEKLRHGEVATSGGWRIYSSGPGIYTNLVVRHLLGLRRFYDAVEFDAVLPSDLAGVTCEMTQAGRQILYHISNPRAGDVTVEVNGRQISGYRAFNPFRKGAIRVGRSVFEDALHAGVNQVRLHT